MARYACLFTCPLIVCACLPLGCGSRSKPVAEPTTPHEARAVHGNQTPDEPETMDKIISDPDKELERSKAELAKTLAELDALKAKQAQTNSTAPTKPKGCIVLLKNTVRVVKDKFSSDVLTGIVENRTGEPLEYVAIIFNAFDKDGAQVDSLSGTTTNLLAGAKWRFETTSGYNPKLTYRCANIRSQMTLLTCWPWKEE